VARDYVKSMQIIPIENLDIKSTVEALKAGAVLVYPTETCYGLGCDATNEKAVERLFEIKKRQKNKSVLVLMADIAMAREYAEWNEKINELALKFWPGPLTLVSHGINSSELADGTIAENGSIAFRVTDHPLAEELTKELGRPLVSTSANIASLESPYDLESVFEMYEGAEKQPDIIIDAGDLPHRTPSTIARVENGEVHVLRQGEIVVE